MDIPFMKKKQTAQIIPGKGFAPIDRVREMASRGFSEPEMIDVLRREGFSADEVDKALTQALRIGVTGEQPQPQMQQQWQPVYQRAEQPQQQFQWPSQQQMQPVPQQQVPQPIMQQQPPIQKQEPKATASGLPTLESLEMQQPQEAMPQIPETSLPEGYYSQQYSNEDYIDYIVQQRVTEITEKMQEFQSRYQDLQRKIEELSTDLRAANVKSGPVNSQMVSKMDQFSETVSDVDNRLSGLEKAFKETLPALIDSVRALSDLVQKAKRVE